MVHRCIVDGHLYRHISHSSTHSTRLHRLWPHDRERWDVRLRSHVHMRTGTYSDMCLCICICIRVYILRRCSGWAETAGLDTRPPPPVPLPMRRHGLAQIHRVRAACSCTRPSSDDICCIWSGSQKRKPFVPCICDGTSHHCSTKALASTVAFLRYTRCKSCMVRRPRSDQSDDWARAHDNSCRSGPEMLIDTHCDSRTQSEMTAYTYDNIYIWWQHYARRRCSTAWFCTAEWCVGCLPLEIRIYLRHRRRVGQLVLPATVEIHFWICVVCELWRIFVAVGNSHAYDAEVMHEQVIQLDQWSQFHIIFLRR